MLRSLRQTVAQWALRLGIQADQLPNPSVLRNGWTAAAALASCPVRPPVCEEQINTWEQSFGYRLPRALREWLLLSDGLYSRRGPLIHPLRSIGPMIPFASVPDLIIQPESWFEIGNPGEETICIDLAYTWPGGDCPVFTSGDDQRGLRPRIIAVGFEDWLLRLLRAGGQAYWFEDGVLELGDPWVEHRRHTPAPPLPERLHSLTQRVRCLRKPGDTERSLASQLGISQSDVELLLRHLQHASLG